MYKQLQYTLRKTTIIKIHKKLKTTNDQNELYSYGIKTLDLNRLQMTPKMTKKKVKTMYKKSSSERVCGHNYMRRRTLFEGLCYFPHIYHHIAL